MAQSTSALTQAFYLSRQFSRLQIETKDYRIHPVLGGISSTRWKAYQRFSRKNSLLVDRLSRQQPFPRALKINRKRQDSPFSETLLSTQVIDLQPERKAKLARRGLLAGDARNNRLIGSRQSDVLTGQRGRDVLVGGPGSDILSGGAGADLFRFRERERRRTVFSDTLVDFDPWEGDRIAVQGARHFAGVGGFTGRRGEVQAMIWMADLRPGIKGPLHPWMVQGVSLAIDDDGDRIADGLIEIPGLASFEAGWLGLS